MYINLNTYWRRFTRNPSRIMWLFSDGGIVWTVLGVLRLFYAFEEQSITSKLGAGEYGLQKLPSRWHRIIQEAVNVHQNDSNDNNSLYKSRLRRFWSAFQFLNYIIDLCNKQRGEN